MGRGRAQAGAAGAPALARGNAPRSTPTAKDTWSAISSRAASTNSSFVPVPVPGAGARADSRDIHHEALSAARSGAVAAGTACHPQARAQAAHTGGAAPCPPNGTAGCCVRVPPAELGVSSVLRVIGCSGARRRVQPMTGGAPPLTGRARSARTAATTRRFTAGASRLRCVGMAQGAASLRECVGVSRVACRVRAATHHGPARWKSTSAAEVLLAPTRF